MVIWMIKILSDINEFENIIKEGIWFVDFNATWCMPCRMLEPVLDGLSNDYNVLKVDIDKFSELAIKYEIMSVPSVFVFKNGVYVNKSIGLVSEDVLRKLI